MSISTYWHTVRYLRPVQVYGRVWRRLYRPRVHRATPLRRRIPLGTWTTPAAKPVRLVGPSEFRFLNATHKVATAADWNNAARDKLWLFNLHYFDDLSGANAGQRADWHEELIGRWISENPPSAGIGWEPYPISLRIVNWIKWVHAGNQPSAAFDSSLAIQARCLATRIEYHLLGNHLLANAKALVMAGLYFAGAEPDSWMEKGLAILRRELPEQILQDGGHFERSPMYHALAVEDILDLINAARTWRGCVSEAELSRWGGYVTGMLTWLNAMRHPDGEIAQLNDSAFDVAASWGELLGYATRLQLCWQGDDARSRHGVTRLAASGYFRVERGDAVLIADLAELGPDYQPAHGHADTLSFELSVNGVRVLVDTGTSTYAPGAQRCWERSTAAHNTVTIDGKDSSEVWGAFRVARRARVTESTVSVSPDVVIIRGAHDGYRRLPGAPVHRREWRLEERRLRVTDNVGSACNRAVARFHLHPDISCSSDGELRLPGGGRARWTVRGGTSRLREVAWHPRFGVSLPATCIEVVFGNGPVLFELEW